MLPNPNPKVGIQVFNSTLFHEDDLLHPTDKFSFLFGEWPAVDMHLRLLDSPNKSKAGQKAKFGMELAIALKVPQRLILLKTAR